VTKGLKASKEVKTVGGRMGRRGGRGGRGLGRREMNVTLPE